MKVFSKDASLVKECKSYRRMQVLSKNASLVKECKSYQQMQVLSKDASLVNEVFLEKYVLGTKYLVWTV